MSSPMSYTSTTVSLHLLSTEILVFFSQIVRIMPLLGIFNQDIDREVYFFLSTFKFYLSSSFKQLLQCQKHIFNLENSKDRLQQKITKQSTQTVEDRKRKENGQIKLYIKNVRSHHVQFGIKHSELLGNPQEKTMRKEAGPQLSSEFLHSAWGNS